MANRQRVFHRRQQAPAESSPATNSGNAIEVHGAASDAHITGMVSASGAGSSATMLAVVPETEPCMHSVGESSRVAGSPAGGISPRAPWSRNIASISRIVRRPLRATSSRLRARRPRACQRIALCPCPHCGSNTRRRSRTMTSLAPSASARIAFDVSRAEIAGVDRESIRDARAILDAARNPLAAGAFKHVSFGVIGDDESAAVAEINVVLRRNRPAHSVRSTRR